ncbi:MAG: AAA family ATPase [Candidatus Methanomethylophilaceae archaeon]
MPLDFEALKTAASGKRRSLLSTVRNAKDIDEETFKIKALLLGDSGGGKSTSACTIPGKKLVLECDRRSESLAGTPDVQVVDIFTWEDAQAVVEELWTLAREEKPFPYSAIIGDSLSSLSRMAMEWSMNLTDSKGKKTPTGLGGVPAQQHYFPQMHAVSQLILAAIPLPCHIVFTGHLDIYEDKVLNTIDIYPKITGKIRTEVSSWFNETYLCARKGGKYYWATAPFQRYTFLKSAMNKLGKYWQGDVELDFSQPPTGFEHLLDLRFRKEAAPQKP